jgi:hypothetical protein
MDPKVAGADQVRRIYANDKTMQTVYLAMGRSTVLRFDDKPKTAVIGNANYFSLEYLNNDITIQPLGQTVTNLFVYSEGQTYGLILRVGPVTHYDDLVYVRYRPGYLSVTPGKRSEPLITQMTLDRSIVIGGKLRLDFKKAIHSIPQGVWIIESDATNLANENINLRDLKFSFSKGKLAIPILEPAFDPPTLSSERVSKIRLFIKTSDVIGISMMIQGFGQTEKLTITKKGLK